MSTFALNMGIQGLLPLLKNATTQCHLSEYKGKSVAVDGYSWLHKATYGCCIELATKQPTNKWINYCMGLLEMLLSFNISVHLVFDGCDLPSKLKTDDGRHAERKKNLEKGLQMYNDELARRRSSSNGNGGKHTDRGKGSDDFHKDSRTLLSRAMNVTPRMAAEFIQAVRKKHPSVNILVAPYEADAQLAYLSVNNIVDAIISEDSDTIPYGCREVLFKLDSRFASCQRIVLKDVFPVQVRGRGGGYDASEKGDSHCKSGTGSGSGAGADGPSAAGGGSSRAAIKALDLSSFSHHMVLIMCVAAGCDYLSSVKGFAIKNAYKYVAKTREVMRLLKTMRLDGLLPVAEAPPPVHTRCETHPNMTADGESGCGCGGGGGRILQYEVDFCRAVITFLHQTVFDPVHGCMVPLYPFPTADGNVDSPAMRCMDSSLIKLSDSCRQLLRNAQGLSVDAPYEFLGGIHPDAAVSQGVAAGLLDPTTYQPFNLPPAGGSSMGNRTSIVPRTQIPARSNSDLGIFNAWKGTTVNVAKSASVKSWGASRAASVAIPTTASSSSSTSTSVDRAGGSPRKFGLSGFTQGISAGSTATASTSATGTGAMSSFRMGGLIRSHSETTHSQSTLSLTTTMNSTSTDSSSSVVMVDLYSSDDDRSRSPPRSGSGSEAALTTTPLPSRSSKFFAPPAPTVAPAAVPVAYSPKRVTSSPKGGTSSAKRKRSANASPKVATRRSPRRKSGAPDGTGATVVIAGENLALADGAGPDTGGVVDGSSAGVGSVDMDLYAELSPATVTGGIRSHAKAKVKPPTPDDTTSSLVESVTLTKASSKVRKMMHQGQYEGIGAAKSGVRSATDDLNALHARNRALAGERVSCIQAAEERAENMLIDGSETGKTCRYEASGSVKPTLGSDDFSFYACAASGLDIHSIEVTTASANRSVPLNPLASFAASNTNNSIAKYCVAKHVTKHPTEARLNPLAMTSSSSQPGPRTNGTGSKSSRKRGKNNAKTSVSAGGGAVGGMFSQFAAVSAPVSVGRHDPMEVFLIEDSN